MESSNRTLWSVKKKRKISRKTNSAGEHRTVSTKSQRRVTENEPTTKATVSCPSSSSDICSKRVHTIDVTGSTNVEDSKYNTIKNALTYKYKYKYKVLEETKQKIPNNKRDYRYENREARKAQGEATSLTHSSPQFRYKYLYKYTRDGMNRQLKEKETKHDAISALPTTGVELSAVLPKPDERQSTEDQDRGNSNNQSRFKPVEGKQLSSREGDSANEKHNKSRGNSPRAGSCNASKHSSPKGSRNTSPHRKLPSHHTSSPHPKASPPTTSTPKSTTPKSSTPKRSSPAGTPPPGSPREASKKGLPRMSPRGKSQGELSAHKAPESIIRSNSSPHLKNPNPSTQPSVSESVSKKQARLVNTSPLSPISSGRGNSRQPSGDDLTLVSPEVREDLIIHKKFKNAAGVCLICVFYHRLIWRTSSSSVTRKRHDVDYPVQHLFRAAIDIHQKESMPGASMNAYAIDFDSYHRCDLCSSRQSSRSNGNLLPAHKTRT